MKKVLSLVCLLAWCTACEPTKAHSRYQLTTDTVVDTATGLTWQRVPPPGDFNLQPAMDYCAGLLLDGSGWRLPNKTELMTLAHKATALESMKQKPTIDRVAFPGTRAARFWATRVGDEPTRVKGWAVDFSTGYNDQLVQPGDGFAVRCVR